MTRTFRSGNGRPCCHRGRRSYPAITKDISLAKHVPLEASAYHLSSCESIVRDLGSWGGGLISMSGSLLFDGGGTIIRGSVPCQGRSSRPRRYRRRFSSCRWLCVRGDKYSVDRELGVQ